MVSSDFRKEARKKLTGKWGTAACIFLAFILLSCALNYVKNMLSDNMQSLVSIAISIIEIPLLFGFTASFVNLFNGESVNPFDFISLGFKNFGKSWGVTLQIIFKLIVPYILYNNSFGINSFGNLFISWIFNIYSIYLYLSRRSTFYDIFNLVCYQILLL